MGQQSERVMSEDLDEDEGVGGLLEVMDPTGHFEVRWGKKKDEIAHAEATFNDLLKKGYTAYIRTWRGRKGKPTTEFDPKAGAVIFEKTEEPADVKTPTPDYPAEKAPPKNAELVEEPDYEPTKKFDKKAETTLVPPLRGG